MPSSDSPEMSFSGIKTQVSRLVREGALRTPGDVADVCAAFQTAVTGVLAKKTVAAALREGVKDVVLGGGVAANSELRRRVIDLAAKSDIRVSVPPIASCTDNAAMIAYAGAMRLLRGEADGWDLVATSRTVLERTTQKGRGRR
jgi:N6-L-threonylcarbamoyladenine synthase